MKWLIPLLFLTGCSFIKTPEEVYVPVHKPCVSTLPVERESEFAKSAGLSIFEQVRSLLIDREQDKIYKAELKAVIEGCK